MKNKWGKITKKWLLAWPKALKVWSSYVRLQEPIWCTDQKQEKKEGLSQSFAMIRLSDHRIVISLRKVEKSDLGKQPSVLQTKNDVCLDFLAWVSQEQPAAARSSQERPAAANSSSLKRATGR